MLFTALLVKNLIANTTKLVPQPPKIPGFPTLPPPSNDALKILGSFVTSTLGTSLFSASPDDAKVTAYEAKHSITLNDYPEKLLGLSAAYVQKFEENVSASRDVNQLRPLVEVLTDEAFLTTLGLDLDTPYADVITAINAAEPQEDIHFKIHYSTDGTPAPTQLQFNLGLINGLLSITKVVIFGTQGTTVWEYVSPTNKTLFTLTTVGLLRTLISTGEPFFARQRLEQRLVRWREYVGALSTPVAVDTHAEVVLPQHTDLSAVAASITKSHLVADGTIYAAYVTGSRLSIETVTKRATLILAMTNSLEFGQNLFVCTDRMNPDFVAAQLPAFISQSNYNATIGGYQVPPADLARAERLFDSLVENKQVFQIGDSIPV